MKNIILNLFRLDSFMQKTLYKMDKLYQYSALMINGVSFQAMQSLVFFLSKRLPHSESHNLNLLSQHYFFNKMQSSFLPHPPAPSPFHTDSLRSQEKGRQPQRLITSPPAPLLEERGVPPHRLPLDFVCRCQT